jgi:putative SOS response-associated peptidase YedK
MCGRYTIYTKAEALQERFHAQMQEGTYSPRYNAAPSQALPVILNTDSSHIVPAQWGFLPSWAKDKDIRPLINARAETAATKPMFRHAMKSNRCLVLADGFYEWKKTEAGKIPYRITLTSEEPFAFAGIWSVLETAEKSLLTFAILTTTPNDLMKDIHNRMPVILPAAAEATWLDPTRDAGDVEDLLQPYSAAVMTAYPVSKRVNIPSIDVPELITPI